MILLCYYTGMLIYAWSSPDGDDTQKYIYGALSPLYTCWGLRLYVSAIVKAIPIVILLWYYKGMWILPWSSTDGDDTQKYIYAAPSLQYSWKFIDDDGMLPRCAATPC